MPGSVGCGVASTGGCEGSPAASAGGLGFAGADGAGVGSVVGGAGVPAGGPAGWSPSTGLAGVSPWSRSGTEGGLSSVRPAPASAVRPWLAVALLDAWSAGLPRQRGSLATSGTEDAAAVGVGARARARARARGSAELPTRRTWPRRSSPPFAWPVV